jgi:hypothetical protein
MWSSRTETDNTGSRRRGRGRHMSPCRPHTSARLAPEHLLAQAGIDSVVWLRSASRLPACLLFGELWGIAAVSLLLSRAPRSSHRHRPIALYTQLNHHHDLPSSLPTGTRLAAALTGTI